jgi:hypothetical protein
MAEKQIGVTPTVYFKGSCACGRMTYECTEIPPAIQACHCVTCRKLSGGPYHGYADIKSRSVTFFDNKEQLRYEGLPKDNVGGIDFLRVSKLADRALCLDCHTPLAFRYKHHHDTDGIGITMGSIDEDSILNDEVKQAMKLQKHIFVSQNPWWYEIKDGLPTHDRFSGRFEQDMNDWHYQQH